MKRMDEPFVEAELSEEEKEKRKRELEDQRRGSS